MVPECGLVRGEVRIRTTVPLAEHLDGVSIRYDGDPKGMVPRSELRYLFSVVAADVSSAIEPRRLARRDSGSISPAREIFERSFRAARRTPSTSGGTPDATLSRY